MRFYGFLEPAQIEFDEAITFYNRQRDGLGYEFAAEVRDTINRMLKHPEAWTKLSKRLDDVEQNDFRTA